MNGAFALPNTAIPGLVTAAASARPVAFSVIEDQIGCITLDATGRYSGADARACAAMRQRKGKAAPTRPLLSAVAAPSRQPVLGAGR